MEKSFRIKFILLSGAIFFILPFFVAAASFGYGHEEDFFIDSDYDYLEREDVSATIRYVGSNAYFYIEDDWWDDLEIIERNEINHSLGELSQEFDKTIHPVLTATYGGENNPGIDGDYRVSILLHQMEEGIAGYFRTMDGYRKLQAPRSNEKEMVYLSVDYINHGIIKSYLAHEFTHLISFNQKEQRIGEEEDIWLNELRAEYSATLLGYDEEYKESNLQERAQRFVSSPSDSVTEWKGNSRDYGVINIFAQYLVEHYGIGILSESMASPYVGIASINYFLTQQDIEKDFAQVFTDWTITVLWNNCELGEEFCFKEEPLSYIRTVPSLIFLPSTQESRLSLIYAVKEWSGHWYKIIGGNKGLKVEFESLSGTDFVIPYLVEKSDKIESINYLELGSDHKGMIDLPYFGENGQSLYIIPSIQQKMSNFSASEPFARFSLDISTFENGEEEIEEENNGEVKPISEMTANELRVKIREIMAQLQILLTELAKLKGEITSTDIPSDFSFNRNLEFGISGIDVKYLQMVLNSDPDTKLIDSGIGSSGQETSLFGSLTQSAVIKFQEKYSSEILIPWNLSVGNGFVGKKTREKLNFVLES
ncbi:MAG: hypothetical protein U9Q96_01880 [Patescibacteria group bacterium]|nr:hypothetical protein [Patescibacteria group bacterium]